MITTILSNRGTKLFVILAGIFVSSALVAEVIGVKIFSLEDTLGVARANISWLGGFSFHLTAGVLLWPIVFIMTDIINEYYGRSGVQFLSYLTVIIISFAFIIFYFAIQLSASPYFTVGNNIPDALANNAFKGIVGQGSWIILGSMAAFMIGQLLDVLVFHKIKNITGEKYIWLRATGSTLVSQLVDSFVVLFIAFYVGRRLQTGQGTPWTIQQILIGGFGNYLYKFVVAIVLTPAIYGMHALIEKYLGHKTAKEMKNAAAMG